MVGKSMRCRRGRGAGVWANLFGPGWLGRSGWVRVAGSGWSGVRGAADPQGKGLCGRNTMAWQWRSGAEFTLNCRAALCGRSKRAGKSGFCALAARIA